MEEPPGVSSRQDMRRLSKFFRRNRSHGGPDESRNPGIAEEGGQQSVRIHAQETTGEPRANKRPFRFGTGSFTAQSRADYLALSRKVEDLGYAVLLTPDHFGQQLAPLTALMAAADATRTLRLGTYVCANDFRHPVILAKEAATLDLLSDGRLELGLGTGYLQFDDETSGIPLDPPGVRISRLEEAIQIIKGLFAEGPLTFSGAYYTVTNLAWIIHGV